MNLLITGATGFLGSRITEHLLDENEITQIIATGRKIRNHNKLIHPKLTYILGDLSNHNFVASLFKSKIDIVINCASLSSPWGSYEKFYSSNILTQKHLINESKKSSINRFIYISSPSIYFDFRDALDIHEHTPVPKKMVNHYAKTKWMAECHLKESNLPYIILRPRALIGRGDTVIMPRLIRSSKEGKLKIIGAGNNRVDLTPVANMVEAVKLSIFTKNLNETFNISNGEPVNLWESINFILSEIGLPEVRDKIPYSILYIIATIMEYKSRVFNKKEPVLTRYAVGVLAKSFTFDIRKAKELLNFEPKQTTNQALVEFIQWYKSKEHE